MPYLLNNKRTLGIDLGIKRTGLAISDEFGISVRALNNLIPKSRQKDIDYLICLCIKFNAKHIVIGHAIRSLGNEGVMAKRSVGFYNNLKKIIKKKI